MVSVQKGPRLGCPDALDDEILVDDCGARTGAANDESVTPLRSIDGWSVVKVLPISVSRTRHRGEAAVPGVAPSIATRAPASMTARVGRTACTCTEPGQCPVPAPTPPSPVRLSAHHRHCRHEVKRLSSGLGSDSEGARQTTRGAQRSSGQSGCAPLGRPAVGGTQQVGRLDGVLASNPPVRSCQVLAGGRLRDAEPMGGELDRSGADVRPQDLYAKAMIGFAEIPPGQPIDKTLQQLAVRTETLLNKVSAIEDELGGR